MEVNPQFATMQEHVRENLADLNFFVNMMVDGVPNQKDALAEIVFAFCKHKPPLEKAEARVALFEVACAKIAVQMHRIRAHSSFPAPPLTANSDGKLLFYLRTLDPEYRVAVLLKDVLKFQDSEAQKILQIRWPIFRHRLHRGRMDILEAQRKKLERQVPPGEVDRGAFTPEAQ